MTNLLLDRVDSEFTSEDRPLRRKPVDPVLSEFERLVKEIHTAEEVSDRECLDWWLDLVDFIPLLGFWSTKRSD